MPASPSPFERPDSRAAPLLPMRLGPHATLRAAALTTLIYYGSSFFIILLVKALLETFTWALVWEFALPMTLVDGALAFSLYFMLGWTRGLARRRRLATLILAVVVVASLQSGWDTFLHHLSGKLLHYYNSAFEAFLRGFSVNIYQTGMLFALMAFQSAYLDARQRERELIVSRDRERRSQMLALRYQINPHFLFNAMNALSSLVVVGRNGKAEQMIERLSDFLRASFKPDPGDRVPLEEEFELIDAYLEIERTRFDERLETAMDLAPELREVPVPAFLLQPLVENAVKYAVAPSRRTVTVRVCAERRGEELVLAVEDDGDGQVEGSGGTGVGLANVRERLALEYRGRARLEAGRTDAGYRAEIRLPL